MRQGVASQWGLAVARMDPGRPGSMKVSAEVFTWSSWILNACHFAGEGETLNVR